MPCHLLGHEDTYALPKGRYGLAISWESGPRSNVDVDLQACVVDDKGTIIDAVYHNNKQALGCVTHSGDERTGARNGYAEVVMAGLSELPKNVKMIIFVVAVHCGGHLKDVKNGKIHLLEETVENEVAYFEMENSIEEVDVVAAFVKSADGPWKFMVVDEAARDGQHFIDVLEPTIGNLIRRFIPEAPAKQQVSFQMTKNSVFDLPPEKKLSTLTVGVGWDASGVTSADLDVSAVMMKSDHEVVDAVYYKKLHGHGLRHSGDNSNGEGEGDDEQIRCDLRKIPKAVDQIYFCVHIYNKGLSFKHVRNPYCRIFDNAGNRLARFELSNSEDASGLVIARLFRVDTNRWGFQALGAYTGGRWWKNSLKHISAFCRISPRDLQLGKEPTLADISSGPTVSFETSQQACCTLQ